MLIVGQLQLESFLLLVIVAVAHPIHMLLVLSVLLGI